MQKELLIIIPAYNEELNIDRVLKSLEIPEISSIADVLVVNDASSDHTNFRAKGRNHKVITHVYNLGYGSALQLGYKYAVRRKYKYVIQMDADGQHDACNILPIYEKLKEKEADGYAPDIVIGSRFLPGAAPYSVSGAKKLAMGLFRKMIKRYTKQNITDPTSGLQGLSRRTFLYYSKYNHFDDRYPDANMLIQMSLLGCRIVEIPAIMHTRKNGSSMHSGIKPILYMIRMVLNIWAVVIRIHVLKSYDNIENY